MCPKNHVISGVLLCFWMALAGLARAQSGSLGGAPVCEASALALLTCPDSPEGRCLLVGDNEVRDRLFLYRLAASGPVASSRRSIMLEPTISDVEALAGIGGAEVLVIGSHSRNKRCESRANRRLLVGLELGPGGASSSRLALRTAVDVGSVALFGSAPTGTLAEVAAAFDRAEAAARRGDCGQALDIEGAVRVDSDLWLGLRRPLVAGRAVMLRWDRTAVGLRFDAARLLELHGRGIRGLSAYEGNVYGLSEGSLWRFSKNALASRKPIVVEHMAVVPPRSEGVVIDAGRAIVVQDGEQGSPRCDKESRFVIVPLAASSEARSRSF